MLITIIIILVIWIAVAFVVGVWVGKKLKNRPEAMAEASLRLDSALETILMEMAESDRHDPT
jgi:flagellar basal body-associated protein FliL